MTDARPDPYLYYRRVSLSEPADSRDGPIIAVSAAGVIMVPIAFDRDRSRGDASADAPGEPLFRFPRRAETDAWTPPSSTTGDPHGYIHEIAVYAGEPVYAVADLREAPGSLDPGGSRQEGPAPIGYRELYGAIGDDELALVSRAMQIVDWDMTSMYCSRCAAATEPALDECVKRCPACGHTQYPRLAPAMIVGVIRDGKLLLGQSPRFRGRFHSILAGFLEPGESAEECVRREVYEEVGISVRTIRYFGSQPWPFPHSLMLGFTAEYESGELNPNPTELVEAGWFAPDEMPNVPGEVSISGRIINWFRSEYG